MENGALCFLHFKPKLISVFTHILEIIKTNISTEKYWQCNSWPFVRMFRLCDFIRNKDKILTMVKVLSWAFFHCFSYFRQFNRIAILSKLLFRYIYLPSFLNSKLKNERRNLQKLKLDYSYELGCLFFLKTKTEKLLFLQTDIIK